MLRACDMYVLSALVHASTMRTSSGAGLLTRLGLSATLHRESQYQARSGIVMDVLSAFAAMRLFGRGSQSTGLYQYLELLLHV